MPVTFSTSFTGINITVYIESLNKTVKTKNQVVPIRTVKQIADGDKTNIDDGFNPYYINLGYTETVSISGYIVGDTTISNTIDYVFPDVLLCVTSSDIPEFVVGDYWEIQSLTLDYVTGFVAVRKYNLGLTKQFYSEKR